MIVNNYLQLTRALNKCPNCTESINHFHVKNDIVTAKCECGFKIKYDTNKGITAGLVKKAIREALRDHKINFCVESVFELEGVKVDREEFEKLSDDELESKVEWFDYLWSK